MIRDIVNQEINKRLG